MSDSPHRPNSVFRFLPEEFIVVQAGQSDSHELWPMQRAFLCQLVLTGPTATLSGSFDVQGSVNNVDFFSLTNNSPMTFAGAGTYALNFSNVAPRFVRGYVTASQGACTGSIYCSVT